MPAPYLYDATPIPFFPKGTTTSAGYTQRQLLVSTATYSTQRIYQTYLSTLMILNMNNHFMSDYAVTNMKSEMSLNQPYQLVKIYVLNTTGPDGDLPYKPGDYFIPNVNCVNLISNTAYPIRGVMPNAVYTELVIEKKW